MAEGISNWRIDSSTTHIGSISIFTGLSQFKQSSQLQLYPHFWPAAKQVQYFLLQRVFLHVHMILKSISFTPDLTVLFAFAATHTGQQNPALHGSSLALKQGQFSSLQDI